MPRKTFHLTGVFVVVLLAGLLLLSQATDLFAQSSKWEARYWNNLTLSGEPVVVRQENEINHDWGRNAPATGVNENDFSVRWRRTVNLPAGTYRFTATMDDGMRVWVDGVLIIDSWTDSRAHTIEADRYLYSGDHQMKVEYYDSGKSAVARFSWRAVSEGGAAAGNWRGEYYNNMSLSGSPDLVRGDAVIDFDWGAGSPAPGAVGTDHFSVRWTQNLNLEAGRYRFTATADDGVRLWVNGRLLIDQWRDQSAASYSAEIDLPGGSIPVTMEYYEDGGGAVARLTRAKVGGTAAIVEWRGEYFNNRDLSGSPALVRDDAHIDFNWGNGSPASGVINPDNFSVRWTRTINLNPGRYQFRATTDDGVRLWVNGQLLINAWYDHPMETYVAEVNLPGGDTSVRMEYYEHVGGAHAHLVRTLVSVAPAPNTGNNPGVATATVIDAYRLNVRLGPGVQYGIITAIPRGQVVTLAGTRNAEATWVKVILPNGTQGWVSARYLQSSFPFSNLTVSQETVPNTGGPTSSGTATVVNAFNLNVRQGPGVGYGVITIIPRNTAVSLLARNANATWVKIQLANGTQGWVNASYLASSTPFANLPLGG